MSTKLQMLQAIDRKLSGVLATTDHKAVLIRKINATLDRAISAMDADKDTDKHRWITTETGSHIKIDGDGNIVAGAGGKFNGKPLSAMGGTKKFTKYATNAEREQSQAKQQTAASRPVLSNNLTKGENTSTLSSTSQPEAANGETTMNASNWTWASKKADEVKGMSDEDFNAYKQSLNVKRGIAPVKTEAEKTANLAMTKEQAINNLIKIHNKLLELDKPEPKTEKTQLEKHPIVAKMEKIGGKEWGKEGEHRVYFDNPADLAGVDFGSNNKNAKANSGKLYYNVTTGEYKWTGGSEFGKTIADAIRAKLAI